MAAYPHRHRRWRRQRRVYILHYRWRHWGGDTARYLQVGCEPGSLGFEPFIGRGSLHPGSFYAYWVSEKNPSRNCLINSRGDKTVTYASPHETQQIPHRSVRRGMGVPYALPPCSKEARTGTSKRT